MEALSQQLAALATVVNQLADSVTKQQDQLNAMSNAITTLQGNNPPLTVKEVEEPRMPMPERFSGDRSDFRNFRNRCRSYFLMRPTASGTEAQRIEFIKTLLRGDAQTWAYSLPAEHSAHTSVQEFFEAMAIVYDDPDVAATAEHKLKKLRQGNKSVEEYASEFRKWSHAVRWEAYSLLDRFVSGLSDEVSELMLGYPEPRTVDEAISLAVRIDRRVRYHRGNRSRGYWKAPVPAPPIPKEEPMQIGSCKITELEKARRRREGLCLYCGTKGHVVANCPKKSENSSA